MGITDRRVFDGDENLNEFGRTGFLVGTPLFESRFPRLHRCGLTGRVGYVDSARG